VTAGPPAASPGAAPEAGEAGEAGAGPDRRPLAFVDLDDTLFQTEAKDPSAGILGAVDREGRPLSWMTAAQRALFDWLLASTRVVVATGRSTDAVDRVRLGLDGPAGSPGADPWSVYAVEAVICSFGGVIRRGDRTPDPDWHALMAGPAEEAAPALERLAALTRERIAAAGLDIRCRVIVDAGLPLYLSVKHNARDTQALAGLAAALAPAVPAGWQTHLNANNLAYMPPFLGKERAVGWYRRHRAGPHPFALALGDSLSDLGYLAACEVAAMPAASQLMRRLAGGPEDERPDRR
jgi:hydroxymethylpyrimidine pyrophosphatase-like HAD family hydrolase